MLVPLLLMSTLSPSGAEAEPLSARQVAPELKVREWINTREKRIELKQLRGKVVILAFVYTGC